MTASTPSLQTWATHPLGKAARVMLGVGGMILATIVLMTAAVVSTGSWALVLAGVALAACAVRAARMPTISRLVSLTAAMIGTSLAFQFI